MISSNQITSLIQKVAGGLGYTIERRHPGIRRSGSAGEVHVTVEDLMQSIHGEDIYEGLDSLAYPEDLAG